MLKKILADGELCDLLRDAFDVDILEDFEEPENEDGHLTYNIAGKTFARDGSGGEFILLEDNSVGYWGTEGQCGRLAADMESFFTLVVNCPWWMDVVNGAMYSDRFEDDENLREFIFELREEYEHITEEMQQQAAAGLGVEYHDDPLDMIKQFRDCATAEPRFISTYREDDGSTHDNSGSLFE